MLDTYPVGELVARVCVEDFHIGSTSRSEVRCTCLMGRPDLLGTLNMASVRAEERRRRFARNDLAERGCITADVSTCDLHSSIHEFHEIGAFGVHVARLLRGICRRNVYATAGFRETPEAWLLGNTSRVIYSSGSCGTHRDPTESSPHCVGR